MQTQCSILNLNGVPCREMLLSGEPILSRCLTNSNWHHIIQYDCVAVFIPQWLIAHCDINRAQSLLELLQGKHSDVQSEVLSIYIYIQEACNRSRKTKLIIFKEFKRKEVIVPVMIVSFVLFFSQSSGLNARNAYSAEIFEAANLENP